MLYNDEDYKARYPFYFRILEIEHNELDGKLKFLFTRINHGGLKFTQSDGFWGYSTRTEAPHLRHEEKLIQRTS